MKKTITLSLDGTKMKLHLIPKDESWLHRTIAKLPVVARSYLTGYYTTIGSTIGVPTSAASEEDFGEPSWVQRRIITMRHEARHARRAQKYTLPLYATGYLGPSVTLGLPALLVTLVLGIAGVSWWPLLWAGVATVVLAPLTVGLAIFRALDEWDAFGESVALWGRLRAERVAQALWRDYFFTVPPSWTVKHFEKKYGADWAKRDQ
jgi:hypothetical protein